MAKSAMSAMGVAITDWIGIDVGDAAIAVQAAESMSKRHQRDVAILQDLKTVFVDDVINEKVLEIIRYEPPKY
jgi:hypothetical protein